MTCENIDQAYWFIENFLFWKSWERTLFLINSLFLSMFGIFIALFISIPFHLIIAVAIWIPPILCSDFMKTLGEASVKIGKIIMRSK